MDQNMPNMDQNMPNILFLKVVVLVNNNIDNSTGTPGSGPHGEGCGLLPQQGCCSFPPPPEQLWW